MTELRHVASRIRSKNAGPFWITIDIFCDDEEILTRVASALPSALVASLLQVDLAMLKRFEMPQIGVIKFSFPRQHPQGSLRDRDLHGAQFANLFEKLAV